MVVAPLSHAETAGPPVLPDAAMAAQVLFLGEQHDNPHHHRLQAEWVSALQPRAIVFEMLTKVQAERITPDLLEDAEALEAALEWHASGWPDFGMYHPIFTASPDAKVLGAAVPRATARQVMAEGASAIVSPEDAGLFGLDQPLDPVEQANREDLQREAHCNALPENLLPDMVAVQRLRDFSLANVARTALKNHGAPVIVITGNGHARKDWGAPFLLRRVDPDIRVFSLGQGEAGAVPAGGFDAVMDAPMVERGDPCAAFR
jgi:uncharacterized iron-regulated protein